MKHLHAAFLTANHPRANNRGETEGNISTLQKLVVAGHIHTTVSGEAIRSALRTVWSDIGSSTSALAQHAVTNRETKEGKVGVYFPLKKPDAFDVGRFADDDVLGYLAAKEGGDRTGRRGRLEVARAVSLRPFLGETVFAARAPMSEKDTPAPYVQEVHVTEMQWGVSFTPGALEVKERAAVVLAGLHALARVAGNHAKFLSGFEPVSVVFRWTDDPAARVLYPYALDGEQPTLAPLARLVDAGDLDPSELVVGGTVPLPAKGGRWIQAAGVADAFRKTWGLMRKDLGFGESMGLPLLGVGEAS